MTWPIVGLIASIVVELAGPDLPAIYVTALGVAVVATAFMLFPEALRRYVDAGDPQAPDRSP